MIVSRNGSMTVAVPKYHPEAWQNIAYHAIPDNPLTAVQTGPAEFTVYYEDEFGPIKVRFVQGSVGEEHVVSLLPHWENQIIRVREPFGREMIPDESQAAKDGVIFVKSANSSPRTHFSKESCATLLVMT
jgi:hypothetical protein